MKALSFALILFLASFQAPAESQNLAKSEAETVGMIAPITAPTPRPVNKLPHKLIYPGDPLYPIELANTGVQGEVKIELVLSPAGKLLSSEIVASSLSAELDKNAMAYTNSESWKLPEVLPEVGETRYLLNVIFNRDSILTINLKTCAQLDTDLTYFRSVRPNDPVKNVASLELIASLFTVQLIKTRGAADALKYAESLTAITDDTLTACHLKPEALLIETYVNAAKQRGIQF